MILAYGAVDGSGTQPSPWGLELHRASLMRSGEACRVVCTGWQARFSFVLWVTLASQAGQGDEQGMVLGTRNCAELRLDDLTADSNQ